MGMHFDGLVEMTRHASLDLLPRGNHARDYLEQTIRQAALFEFPSRPEEVRGMTGKEHDAYLQYLADYKTLSLQHDKGFITPFPVVAVEDPVSVVVLDNRRGTTEIDVTMAGVGSEGNYVLIGKVHVTPPDPHSFNVNVERDTFHAGIDREGRLFTAPPDGSIEEGFLSDIGTNALSCMQEIIYMMDPENFIIRVESPLARQQAMRDARKGNRNVKHDRLYKTVLRPHYVVTTSDDTSAFLQGKANAPRPAHAVRGHWRRLQSERFVNKRGQILFIEQYFTGEGIVNGAQGMRYEVMVKEGPDRVVPYRGRF